MKKKHTILSSCDRLFWLLEKMAGGKGRSRGSRRKRLPPSENCEVPNYYSSAGEDENISGKDIKDVKISGCKEDEISKLRELNQVLLEKIQSSRKEKARFLRKIAEIESRNNNIEAVKRNFQSEMDNLYGDLIEQGKMREELKDQLKESERDTEELREQLKHLMPGYRVTGHSLVHENEMLQEKLDGTRSLLEIQSKRIEEQNVESGRLKKQVEELSRLSGELEDKNSELLEKNEQEGKIIKSLQEQNVSLGSEKSLLHKNLDEVSKRSKEISEKCLKSNLKMLELENQSWGLHTELAAAKSAYDEVIAQLNKIKEHMEKLSSDSYQIQEERDALEKKLVLQLSRNKTLTEELKSVKSSFEEMKVSASNSAKEKGHQFFDIQNQLLAMTKQKKSQLVDSHDQLSILSEAKYLPVDKITELGKRTSVCGKERIPGKIRKPEAVLNPLRKSSESSRARAVEKKGYLADLQHLSGVAEADKGLGERSFKNYSSLTGLNKCPTISERRECESSLAFLNKDPEARDIQLQHLKPKGQALQSHVPAENGKSNVIPKKTKPNGLNGNEKPSSVKVKPKPNGIHEKTKPDGVCKQKALRKMPEKPKPKVWSP